MKRAQVESWPWGSSDGRDLGHARTLGKEVVAGAGGWGGAPKGKSSEGLMSHTTQNTM